MSAGAHLQLVRDLFDLDVGHSLQEVQAAKNPTLWGMPQQSARFFAEAEEGRLTGFERSADTSSDYALMANFASWRCTSR